MADKLFLTSRPLFGNKFARIVFHRMKGDSGSILMQPAIENCFNAQINAELFAGYTYLAMANYFGHQKVALPGCKAFYLEQVNEEQEHARKLIEYVNQRGGKVLLHGVAKPEKQSWDSPLEAFKEALVLELEVTQKLLQLHRECQRNCDLPASNLIESDFLGDQVKSVDKLSRLISQMQRTGCEGLALHLFDQFLLNHCNQ